MAAGDGLRVGPGLSVFFFHPRRSVAVLKGESHKIFDVLNKIETIRETVRASDK